MDIHKPKAVHGWRELLKEIGIIVIGVLIALGAEQAVDAIHWMHQVDAGEEILKGAFAKEVQNAALRDAQSDCITKRLAFLSAVVQHASEDGRLPALDEVGHPPYTPWTIGSWQPLVTSQTISHLPRQTMINYSIIAQMTVFLSGESDQEEAHWTILDTMAGPGRRLSDAEAQQLRITLAQASDANVLMHRTADVLRNAIRATKLLDPMVFDEAVRAAMRDKKDAAICRSLVLPLQHDTKANTHG
jgi:hypothetical protein